MSAVIADVVAVRVPDRTWRSEWRAVKVVWWREVIRFAGNRARMAWWLIQPLLFLFVLGTGLQTLSAASTHGVDLRTFIFPGVLCMTVMFTALFTAPASMVFDRELGFLREMIVAPVSRSSILLGKCLGGTTVAASQGLIVLALAWLVDVPYDPLMVLGVLALLLLVSFAVTAFGLLVAVSIKQAQTFTSVSQMFTMPMIFLSGALYPIAGLAAWLGVLTKIDPLTYAVDPMRVLVFAHLDVSETARQTLAPGVSWWGWHLSPVLEATMVLVLGAALLGAAIWRFSRTE